MSDSESPRSAAICLGLPLSYTARSNSWDCMAAQCEAPRTLARPRWRRSRDRESARNGGTRRHAVPPGAGPLLRGRTSRTAGNRPLPERLPLVTRRSVCHSAPHEAGRGRRPVPARALGVLTAFPKAPAFTPSRAAATPTPAPAPFVPRPNPTPGGEIFDRPTVVDFQLRLDRGAAGRCTRIRATTPRWRCASTASTTRTWR